MVVELSWFQVEDVENPHSGPTTASTTNSTFNYVRDIVGDGGEGFSTGWGGRGGDVTIGADNVNVFGVNDTLGIPVATTSVTVLGSIDTYGGNGGNGLVPGGYGGAGRGGDGGDGGSVQLAGTGAIAVEGSILTYGGVGRNGGNDSSGNSAGPGGNGGRGGGVTIYGGSITTGAITTYGGLGGKGGDGNGTYDGGDGGEGGTGGHVSLYASSSSGITVGGAIDTSGGVAGDGGAYGGRGGSNISGYGYGYAGAVTLSAPSGNVNFHSIVAVGGNGGQGRDGLWGGYGGDGGRGGDVSINGGVIGISTGGTSTITTRGGTGGSGGSATAYGGGGGGIGGAGGYVEINAAGGGGTVIIGGIDMRGGNGGAGGAGAVGYTGGYGGYGGSGGSGGGALISGASIVIGGGTGTILATGGNGGTGAGVGYGGAGGSGGYVDLITPTLAGTVGTGGIYTNGGAPGDNSASPGGNGLWSITGNAVTIADDNLGFMPNGSVSASVFEFDPINIASFSITQTAFTQLSNIPTVKFGKDDGTTSSDLMLTGTVDLTGTSINTLSLKTTGAVSQQDSSPGDATLAVTNLFAQGGSVSLLGAALRNNVVNLGGGAISGNFEFYNANALELGALSLGSGTLTVNAVGITQTGAITQASGAGAATFNSGAGVITLTNAGNDFTGLVNLSGSAVSISDVNAVTLGTVNTSTLTVNAVGISQTVPLTISGTSTFTAGAGPISLTSATNDFGTVSLNNSGANNVAVTDANALTLGASSVGSGTLTVNAVGITQSGAITQAAAAGAATFNAGAGAITLTNAGNDFTGAVSLNNSGANNVAVTDANAIQLGTSGVGSGTLTVNAAGAIAQSGAIMQAAGAGAATFNGGPNPITLTNAANDFTGAVSLNNSGANNVAITDAHALVLGASNVGSGTLTITADGTITQTGPIVQAAGAGLADFVTTTAGGSSITLSNAGNDFTGAVNFDSGTQPTVITDANSIILQGGGGGGGSGDLTINANGMVSQSGAFGGSAGNVVVNAGVGPIVFTDPGNNFVATSISANSTGAVSLVNAAAMNLAASTIGGALSLTAGGVTQTGAITVGGTSTINAGANPITLTNAGNAFTGAVALTNSGANAVAISSSGPLALGASTLGSGALTVNAVGITQSGPIVQVAGAGAATFNGGAGAITLANAGNDFTGAVSLKNSGANNVAITDANAIQLGTLAVGSSALTVSASGAIIQTGAITQAAGAGAATFSAGANPITLTNAANDFTGAVSLNNSGANNVAITDANALVLGTSNVGSGTLTITAGGAITQTGPIVQAAGAGLANFVTTTAGGSAITLSNAGNDFTGLVDFDSGTQSAVITDANSIVLQGGGGGGGGSGDLTINANGTVSQSGAFGGSAGNVVINAGTGPIVFTDPANNFVAASFAANTTGAVSLANAAAMNLAASTIGGALSLTAGGVTQTGALTVGGTSTINAGANQIALTNAGNAFTGAVALSNSGANAVAISSSGALALGASTLGSGALTVNAVGITQSGPIVQAAGAGSATFNGGAGAITLANAGNDFTGVVSLNNSGANNVSITDANAIELGTSAVGSGTLAVNAAGIAQSGAIVASSLVTKSVTGTTLTDAGNQIASFTATNSGSGNVALTNIGALSIGGISNSGGNIAVDNTGAITTVGAVTAPAGSVSIVAHSPLTIGTGGVSAGGDILLTAGGTTAATDNLTLNGAVATTGSTSSIALIANDNLVQNANVTTGGGGVNAVAQTGSISMAPGATTSTSGGSISYTPTAGNATLSSLDAGSGSIALVTGGNIDPVTGFSGANLIGGAATIVAGGNVTLNTQVKLLDVTANGTFSIFDLLTGSLITNVPAPPPVPTTVTDQVLTTVTTTQQQLLQTTDQTQPLLPPTVFGDSGTTLLTSGTQTIGGTTDNFGDSGQGDKPGDDKKKDDDKSKGEGTSTKKDEGKPAEKKIATCS
jgi:hypothetical protein